MTTKRARDRPIGPRYLSPVYSTCASFYFQDGKASVTAAVDRKKTRSWYPLLFFTFNAVSVYSFQISLCHLIFFGCKSKSDLIVSAAKRFSTVPISLFLFVYRFYLFTTKRKKFGLNHFCLYSCSAFYMTMLLVIPTNGSLELLAHWPTCIYSLYTYSVEEQFLKVGAERFCFKSFGYMCILSCYKVVGSTIIYTKLVLKFNIFNSPHHK